MEDICSICCEMCLNNNKNSTNMKLGTCIIKCIISVKGKAIPLQALTGPEGSRRLRLPDFMTIDK
jgi:hypothetical protein